MPRRNITDEMLTEAVINSESVMGVLRYLGIREAGGSNSHYKRRIIAAGIDMSHFTGQLWNKGRILTTKRKPPSEILILRIDGRRAKTHELVRSMLHMGIDHKCALCDQGNEWNGNKLTLDVDHINENWLDDRIENLRFLCPNCHSQLTRKLI